MTMTVEGARPRPRQGNDMDIKRGLGRPAKAPPSTHRHGARRSIVSGAGPGTRRLSRSHSTRRPDRCTRTRGPDAHRDGGRDAWRWGGPIEEIRPGDGSCLRRARTARRYGDRRGTWPSGTARGKTVDWMEHVSDEQRAITSPRASAHEGPAPSAASAVPAGRGIDA
jgi:hypothetical protein